MLLLSIVLTPVLLLASGTIDTDSLAALYADEPVVPIPPARSGHTAFYDPVRRRLIVFGGDGYNDTWALSLGQAPSRWTELFPTDKGPPGAYGHTAIYDPKRHRMIVFGGVQTDNNLSNDVWALSLSNLRWTKLEPQGDPPPPREWHSAIYDPVRDRMIVYGGWTSPEGVLDDAWALDLSSDPFWARLPASPTPPGHRFHSAVYDERRDRMVVFSGSGRVGAPREIWSLSLSTLQWTELGTTGSWPPAVPYGRPAVLDAASDRLVVDGGVDGGVWFLSLGSLAWSRIVSFGAPIPRDGQTATFDPLHRRMIVFGGFTTFDRVEGDDLADSWAFDVDAGTWSEIDPSAGPRPSAVPDSLAAATRRETIGEPFALEGLRPAPAIGDLLASISLPSAAPARLELFDVSGRVRLARDVGGLGAGRHLLRLGSSGSVPTGIYWLKLTQGSRALVTRGVVLR